MSRHRLLLALVVVAFGSALFAACGGSEPDAPFAPKRAHAAADDESSDDEDTAADAGRRPVPTEDPTGSSGSGGEQPPSGEEPLPADPVVEGESPGTPGDAPSCPRVGYLGDIYASAGRCRPSGTEALTDLSGAIEVGEWGSASFDKWFQCLSTVDGYIRFTASDLRTVTAFPRLEKLFALRFEESGVTTATFPKLAELEELSIQKSQGPQGLSFGQLSRIKTVDIAMSALGDLSMLTGVEVIDSVKVRDVNKLHGLEGLKAAGRLELTGFADEDLTALSSLTSVYSLRIEGATHLVSLRGLENLTELNDLTLIGNPALQSLAGLENTGVYFKGGVVIEDNAVLADVSALYHLETVGMQFRIVDNPLLSSCAVKEHFHRAPQPTAHGLRQCGGLRRLPVTRGCVLARTCRVLY